jgi:hypothetical protein
MTRNQSIARQALSLLGKSPESAGLTMTLSGGGEDFVRPNYGKSPLGAMVIMAAGIRAEQCRPQYDLRVYIDDLGDRGDQFRGRIERITGMAVLETIPDPSEHLGSFEGGNIDEVEQALCECLEANLPQGLELTLTSIFYRHNEFGQKSFSANRGDSRNRGLTKLMYGPSQDTEMVNFVDEVVTKAMNWSPEGRSPRSISLWFTVNGEGLKTIYTSIEVQGAKFVIEANDHAFWPWRDKAISCRVSTKEQVKDRIVDYISRQYAFELSQLEVYFAWSEAL